MKYIHERMYSKPDKLLYVLSMKWLIYRPERIHVT